MRWSGDGRVRPCGSSTARAAARVPLSQRGGGLRLGSAGLRCGGAGVHGARVHDARGVRCRAGCQVPVDLSCFRGGRRMDGLQVVQLLGVGGDALHCNCMRGATRQCQAGRRRPGLHSTSHLQHARMQSPLTRLRHPAILLGWQRILAYGRLRGRGTAGTTGSVDMPRHVTVGLGQCTSRSHERLDIWEISISYNVKSLCGKDACPCSLTVGASFASHFGSASAASRCCS